MVDLGVCNIDTLIFDDLLELFVVKEGVSVQVSIFQSFFEQQEAFGSFRG